MKQMNILDYIKLDSFGVEVDYSKSKTELLSFFNENNITVDMPNDMQVVVKSKLLSVDIEFFVAFRFNNEKLTFITISPNTIRGGDSLNNRYNKVQKALRNELGPTRNFLRPIMNLLDPNNRSMSWKKRGIKVKHYLFERFETEEIISIEFQI